MGEVAERVAEMRRENPREFVADVAQKVLGWRFTDEDPDDEEMRDAWPCVTGWWVAIDGHPRAYKGHREQWRPLADAAADFAVLKHVRETWDAKLRATFREYLWALWEHRRPRSEWAEEAPLRYEPGDYAAAALTVAASAGAERAGEREERR